jgi:hypothetical protein
MQASGEGLKMQTQKRRLLPAFFGAYCILIQLWQEKDQNKNFYNPSGRNSILLEVSDECSRKA